MAVREQKSRSWGWLEVRSVDEDKRIIEGIATTSKQARDGDIIETGGIEFKLPIPFLYRHSEPMGNVISAKVSDDRITVRIQVAPAGVSAKIDEYWNLVKSGTVRGLSIGWRTILEAFDKAIGGYRIMKSEWMELSAVPVPADANAQITAVRSADEAILAAIGRTRSRQNQNPPGASGQRNEKPMKGITERITALEQERETASTRMAEIMEAASGREFTAEESAEFDPLMERAEKIDVDLRRNRALAGTAATSRPVVAEGNGSGRAAPAPSAKVEVTSNLPKGTGMTRAIIALVRAGGNHFEAERLAKQYYKDTPEVAMFLNGMARAAVEAGDTTTAAWGGFLVPQAQQLQDEFLALLRPETIIGKVRNFRRVPFNVRVPVQSGGGTYGWVGEAKAKPVTSLQGTTASLTWAKVAGIIAITDELARFSSPQAEAVIRQDMIEGVAKFLDEQFVDPAVAATADNPASITNSIAAASGPSGATAAAFRVDVQALCALFIADSQRLSRATILMSETLASSLASMVNALGSKEFPGITVTGGEYNGIPIIASESVSDRLILFSAPDILLAEDPGTRIETSNQASIEMSTTPISGDTSPSTNAVLKSLWQNNLVGIRVERYVKWQRGRTTAVRWMDNVAYVPS